MSWKHTSLSLIFFTQCMTTIDYLYERKKQHSLYLSLSPPPFFYYTLSTRGEYSSGNLAGKYPLLTRASLGGCTASFGPHGEGKSLILGMSPLARASWMALSGSFCSATAAARWMATPGGGGGGGRSLAERDQLGKRSNHGRMENWLRRRVDSSTVGSLRYCLPSLRSLEGKERRMSSGVILPPAAVAMSSLTCRIESVPSAATLIMCCSMSASERMVFPNVIFTFISLVSSVMV
jgi:hypothetical protein